MRRRAAMAAGAFGLASLGATAYVPWEDLTEADWLYALATRFSTLDGRRVHYPTPTRELVAALEGRSESAARRHLAETRLELGDKAGAVAAMEQWAQGEGPAAWAEAARWAAAHGEMALAFRAAEKAVAGLQGEEQRSLLDEQVGWAEAHPEMADALALRKRRAELRPHDAFAAEDAVRALEAAGRLEEADAAVAAATSMSEERRLLVRSDLLADHGKAKASFELLDAALQSSPHHGPDVREAFARRVDGWGPGLPETWRAALDKAYDGAALVRLASYFQGKGRGGAAADLLRQVERRYESGFDRAAWLVVSRLEGEIDSVPEAFRSRLAAARGASPVEQADDLAGLVDLALRAGGRALAVGSYNDEPYRWVARLDRTPGFWTGGLSFLLTGEDWKAALARLETESLPERTFATARALLGELVRRAPSHAQIPSLRARVMARHVERGEGKEALDLLPLLEAGPPAVAAEARRTALLAARLVALPVSEEQRLFKARLLALAPDASRPSLEAFEPYRGPRTGKSYRPATEPAPERYRDVLEDAIARLDQRDATHGASLALILGEMDRLPDAEALWLDLATRLEGWNLDDDLGPRYEQALARFPGEGIWARAARWYARRERTRDLDRLAGELAARFRGAAIFARAYSAAGVTLSVPSQPPAGARVRLVEWADWVRLRALERFPHSPVVFREARGRLLARSVHAKAPRRHDQGKTQPVIVEDALLEDRRFALLFVAKDEREEYLSAAMKEARLEKMLLGLEGGSSRTPVEDLLLFDGWSRLSRFEKAAPHGDRLAAAYPGDGELARRVLSLHRSLAGIEAGHEAPAAAVVARTAPALADPNPLFTELGELQLEAGHKDAARKTWDRLLEREPRSPEKILELATLLWDYGEMADALSVLEEGRRRLARPNLHAFEAGVLREERRDAEGAVQEYLKAALPPEDDDCFCSWFERDQRALRRLSQLLGRPRVEALVRSRIMELRPGVAADEHTLAALLPLAQIGLPDPDLDWTADDWIDALDMPNDPRGRAERAAARADWRPGAQAAIVRTGDALLGKTLEMAPKATNPELLATIEQWSAALLDERWAKDREVGFRSAVLLRRAELTPNAEERVVQEVARARYLWENGHGAEADAAWAALAPRIGALPEGASRMHAEADRAAFLERSKGTDAAAAEWGRIAGRYPWSLGILEDRVAFLARVGRAAEGRALLEAAIPRAAAGHREALLERLTADALAASDLAQARRVVGRLLAEPSLTDAQRLGALRLLSRLSLREDPRFDLMALAKAEQAKLPREAHADLFQTLAAAAEAEKADKSAVTVWIEALNRRLERTWVRQATRAALRAGEADSFAKFFETQQARSPRDVRWAVAVRELRLERGDLEGAIAMAKAAVAVRPEREGLWREAADLLARAGRPAEAADFLEGWQKPRPADEDAARLRGALYARAGQPDKTLAVEQAALAAFIRTDTLAEGEDEESRKERAVERRSRVVSRLLDLGLPRQAWRVAVGGAGARGLAASGLSPWDAAQVALASGQFLPALEARFSDVAYKSAAAGRLRDYGRPETRQEVLAFLLDRALPQGPPPARTPKPAVMASVAGFATEAGALGPLQEAMARRVVSLSPGPWQADPTPTFITSVAEVILAPRPNGEMGFVEPPLEALFARDLVSRGRDEALFALLEPRWQQALATVRSAGPVPRDGPLPAWALWLDDKDTMEAWARAAAARPERVADVASVLTDRKAWDRLWAVAARGWNVGALVAVVPEEARAAWFRHWQKPSPQDADVVVRARGEAVAKAEAALARLVMGRPDATRDPLIEKLRGPRTVGDVLEKDARWLWPEFITPTAPRNPPDPEERLLGTGPDIGRLPGALWGEQPGAAWFALETLARFRDQDKTAALVPMESPGRGGESDRALLAVRLASSLGDDALASELDESLPGGASPARFERRLRLLVRQGKGEEAKAAMSAQVGREQATMTEAGYLTLARLAEDLGLPDPIASLDPARPITPAFLAFLYDRRGPGTASRFSATDQADFRSALANRWSARAGSLSADAVRFHLATLWTADAAPLPAAGLRRLGPAWVESAAWLAHLRAHDRTDGLAAVGALPDTARLEEMLGKDPEPGSDVVRLMRLRALLWRGEDGKAAELFAKMVDETGEGATLSYAPVALRAQAPDDEEEPAEEAIAEDAAPSEPGDAVTSRLRSWMAPFLTRKKLDLVRGALLGGLRQRRERAPVPASEWVLAVEATAEADRASFFAEMDRAFVRGDLPAEGLGPIAHAVARVSPEEAARWLERWPVRHSLDDVALRVRALAAMKDPAGAQRVVVEAREAGQWSLVDEVKAFDLWRRTAPPPAAAGAAASAVRIPASWVAGRAFWTRRPAEVDADLRAHLRANAFDVRAARAALRSATAGDEAAMRAAQAVLREAPDGVVENAASDSAFLGLRTARGLLKTSPRAAFTALGHTDGAALAADLVARRIPAAEIDGAIADVARIAAANGALRASEGAVAALEARSAEAGARTRREVRAATRPAPPPGYRTTANGPAPFRPRDLDFPLVAAILTAAQEQP